MQLWQLNEAGLDGLGDACLAAEQAGFVVAVELQMLGGGALTLSSSLSWQLC